MRAGYSLYVQNAGDWDRFEAQERGEDVSGKPVRPDNDIWREELQLVHQVEDLGFDALWCVEHHFTPYTMVPNPLQLLSYMAGATKRMDMGTMVVVLPWHDPIRVVEELIMLDTFLGPDRDVRMAVGRGLGRREFGGFGIHMDESRPRFQEAVDIIKLGLLEDRFSYDGQFFKIPETTIRPRPRDGQRILDNMHCAWGSMESMEIAAANGLKPVVIPSKSYKEYEPELERYTELRREQGLPPVGPVVAVHAYCAETEEAAYEGAKRHLDKYGDTVNRHYEFSGGHLAELKSYQHYAEKYKKAQETGAVQTGNVFLDEHIWGTPEMCIEKLERLRELMHASSELVFMMKFGEMSYAEAEDSVQLFGREVLPAVHAMPDAVLA
jgi:alkanesulfonate monooxygenase SsuD/methylene tetrahydromethanopterin reductase-like flavin-dependent oxidoreductase (luciferase family)